MKDNKDNIITPIPLPYAFDALEPVLAEELLRIHYTRFYQSHIDRLNAILAGRVDQPVRPVDIIAGRVCVPREKEVTALRSALAVYTHDLYFYSIGPERQSPTGKLGRAIKSCFSSTERFAALFKHAAAGIYGSGCVWLYVTRAGELKIVALPEYEAPLSRDTAPILVFDAWEHAYVFQYLEERAAYIDALYGIIDWERADRRFCAATEGK